MIKHAHAERASFADFGRLRQLSHLFAKLAVDSWRFAPDNTRPFVALARHDQ
jgi:hypothetical protein